MTRLLDLLPAVHARRDDGTLSALLAIVDQELDRLEEDVEGLWDDWFVETCDEWVLPYLADLLGAPHLRPMPGDVVSLRAWVANTIAYRRRKGTAAVLEQLARDVSGWPARAVEEFVLLGATQHLAHVRPGAGGTLDLRDRDLLERLPGGTGPLAAWQGAFDRAARTVDVRTVTSGRGTHNLPNVAVWTWRLVPHVLTVPLTADAGGPNRFRMSQAGIDVPLVTLPRTEQAIEDLATEPDVPGAIRREALRRDLARARPGDATALVGRDRSLAILDGAVPAGRDPQVDPTEVAVSDLGSWTVDAGIGTWNPADPAAPVVVDPVTSRLLLPDRFAADTVRVRSVAAATADLGGGPYDRADRTAEPATVSIGKSPLLHDPVDHASLAAALAAWTADPVDDTIVELVDSERYGGTLDLVLPPGIDRLVVRAADSQRPWLAPTGGTWRITCTTPATVVMDGLVLAGGLEVEGPLDLEIAHTTLVPGHSLTADGSPRHPDRPSLVVAPGHDTTVFLDHAIVGPLRMPPRPARVEEDAPLQVRDSIVQAPDGPTGPLPAIAADDTGATGVEALVDRSTVLGAIHVAELSATSSILAGRVDVARVQAGCLRFSFVGRGDAGGPSRTPRRHRCEPDRSIARVHDLAMARATAAGDVFGPAEAAALEARLVRSVRPTLVTDRWGQPGYGQLTGSTPEAIRTGGEQGTEMGVLAGLLGPVREANLRRALAHYTRHGTEVGVLHQS